jgi:hypothetical protein
MFEEMITGPGDAAAAFAERLVVAVVSVVAVGVSEAAVVSEE